MKGGIMKKIFIRCLHGHARRGAQSEPSRQWGYLEGLGRFRPL